MLPVISDFLFDDPDEPRLRELALLNATHDVFLVLIDSAFAFELPRVSAGLDRDRRRRDRPHAARISRAALAEAGRSRAASWQDAVQRRRKDLDLDVVRIGLDQTASDIALSEFVAERRLRKTYN